MGSPRSSQASRAIIALALVLVAAHLAIAIKTAIALGQMYVSDEVWYVEAARNLANDFGIVPGGAQCATVPLRLDNVTVLPVQILKNVCDQLNLSCSLYGRNDTMAWVCGDPDAILAMLYALHLPARFGWRYSSDRSADILFYYNWEHPPLFKYWLIVAIAILDNPYVWRAVPIIVSTVTMILAIYAAYRVAGPAVATIAGIILLFSPAFNSLSSVAMLDIGVALSLAALLAIYAAYRDEAPDWLIGIALGIGISIKWTAFFNFLAAATLWGWRKTLRSAVVAGAIYAGVYVPLVAKYGFMTMVRETLWALQWHTMAKCIGPRCPPPSAPWDWFFANHIFTMYLSPRLVLQPSLTPFLPILVFTYLFLRLLARMWSEVDTVAFAAFVAPWLGYVLLYLVGDITQYSYYTAHLAPGLAIAAAIALRHAPSLVSREALENLGQIVKMVRAVVKSRHR
ncbi:MAG: phospholipid carrier-dependent glycosyltransferase [Crenarchaeota archaeon]|nr:phospholipid carrier-dependent glycosyltransferase [Thermoproteota archaeon]